MTVLCVVDVESTGLDPDRHQPWEIAVVVRGHRDRGCDGEWLWQLKPDLTAADPRALRIGRYYARQEFALHEATALTMASPWFDGKQKIERSMPQLVAARLALLLDGALLAGAVPSFDAAFLERFLRGNDQCPTWSHRLVCVETLTAGHFGRLVGGLADCARELGLEVDPGVAHTALGDARLARDIYDAIIGEPKGRVPRITIDSPGSGRPNDPPRPGLGQPRPRRWNRTGAEHYLAGEQLLAAADVQAAEIGRDVAAVPLAAAQVHATLALAAATAAQVMEQYLELEDTVAEWSTALGLPAEAPS